MKTSEVELGPWKDIQLPDGSIVRFGRAEWKDPSTDLCWLPRECSWRNMPWELKRVVGVKPNSDDNLLYRRTNMKTHHVGNMQQGLGRI